MYIIEIAALENGAHRNQTFGGVLPDGWALVTEDVSKLENFPFGEVTAEKIGDVMTMTTWTPGTIPEPEIVEAEPTEEDDTASMLVDHEYRLTMLELGLTE